MFNYLSFMYNRLLYINWNFRSTLLFLKPKVSLHCLLIGKNHITISQRKFLTKKWIEFGARSLSHSIFKTNVGPTHTHFEISTFFKQWKLTTPFLTFCFILFNVVFLLFCLNKCSRSSKKRRPKQEISWGC